MTLFRGTVLDTPLDPFSGGSLRDGSLMVWTCRARFDALRRFML